MAAEGRNLEELEKHEKIINGFRINWMNMRDADSGSVKWESEESFWDDLSSTAERKLEVPGSILGCKAVSREMNFSSKEMIRDFRLVQKVMFMGHQLEVWEFNFGFVIPGSTNTWQCVIEAAAQMLPVDQLDGNIVIETAFYDGDALVSKNSLRVYYV